MEGMKLNVVTGDPARHGDAFGVVGLEGTYPERVINIRHAKQFIKKPYSIVAAHLKLLQKKVNPKIMAIETNYRGKRLLPLFRDKYELPLFGIHTSANLTDETRRKGFAMDKPFMIKWYAQQQKNHRILYPNNRTADMDEMITQDNEIVGITQPTGHTSYKRMRGRHDDLFMAKLIGCNFIRLWWEELENNNV